MVRTWVVDVGWSWGQVWSMHALAGWGAVAGHRRLTRGDGAVDDEVVGGGVSMVGSVGVIRVR